MDILEYEFGSRYNERIKIKFTDDNKPFSRSEGLYVGFSKNNENYVFEVTTKTVFPNNYECNYKAVFLGYHLPKEEDVMTAVFDWITDKDIIRKAHKEAGYT